MIGALLRARAWHSYFATMSLAYEDALKQRENTSRARSGASSPIGVAARFCCTPTTNYMQAFTSAGTPTPALQLGGE
jgi:hypothetical protein